MVKCECCGKETNSKRFCSHSCRCKFTNKLRKGESRPFKPRKELPNKCKCCGVGVYSGITYCKQCSPQQEKLRKLNLKTLKEVIAKRHRHQKHIQINEAARNTYLKSDKPKFCINCGYKDSIQVAHIKPISSFPEDTLIGEINNLDNLIALCYPCHLKFDRGNLTLEDIKQNSISN